MLKHAFKYLQTRELRHFYPQMCSFRWCNCCVGCCLTMQLLGVAAGAQVVGPGCSGLWRCYHRVQRYHNEMLNNPSPARFYYSRGMKDQLLQKKLPSSQKRLCRSSLHIRRQVIFGYMSTELQRSTKGRFCRSVYEDSDGLKSTFC